MIILKISKDLVPKDLDRLLINPKTHKIKQ